MHLVGEIQIESIAYIHDSDYSFDFHSPQRDRQFIYESRDPA